MLSISKHYIPSRPINVLHVIGLVGVGKTRFLQKYFPSLPIFDPSTFDIEFSYIYADPNINSKKYLLYRIRLQREWDDFLQEHDPREDIRANFCVGVESLGINDVLNALLVPYFPTTILIQGDSPPISNKEFWIDHPHGIILNDLWSQKFATKTIRYTHLFNPENRSFSSLLSPEFYDVSPQLASVTLKSLKEINPCTLPHKMKCSTCGASFFTQDLLKKHLYRHNM